MLGRFYRYIVEHDLGFAPNPFHGVCTLANCKPTIRRVASIGDIVAGFAGASYPALRGRLIYWMLVEEKMTFDQYFSDARFYNKKPITNGSLIRFYGDNIYFTNTNGIVTQLPSFHSKKDNTTSPENLKRDTARTKHVLISRTYGYYGRNAPRVPLSLQAAIPIGRGHRRNLPHQTEAAAIAWLLHDLDRGFHGFPAGWAV